MRLRAFLILGLCSVFSGGKAQENDVTHKQILAQYLKNAKWRQSNIKSFLFEFELTTFLPKGALNEQVELSSPGVPRKGSNFPPSPEFITCIHRLVAQELDLAYTFETLQWSTKTGRIERFPSKGLVKNGKTTISDENGSVIAGHQQVRVRPERRLVEVSLPEVRPIWLALRGANPEMTIYDVTSLSPDGEEVLEDGVTYVRFRRSHAPGKSEAILHFSKGEFPAVRRIAHLVERKKATEIDIAYSEVESFGSFPSDWTVRFFDGNSRIERSMTARRTKLEINPSLNEADLSIVLRPGAIVLDKTTDRFSIVDKEGRSHYLSRQEIQSPHEQLMKSRSYSRWQKLVFVPIAILVAGFITLAILRRRSVIGPKMATNRSQSNRADLC